MQIFVRSPVQCQKTLGSGLSFALFSKQDYCKRASGARPKNWPAHRVLLRDGSDKGIHRSANQPKPHQIQDLAHAGCCDSCQCKSFAHAGTQIPFIRRLPAPPKVIAVQYWLCRHAVSQTVLSKRPSYERGAVSRHRYGPVERVHA